MVSEVAKAPQADLPPAPPFSRWYFWGMLLLFGGQTLLTLILTGIALYAIAIALVTKDGWKFIDGFVLLASGLLVYHLFFWRLTWLAAYSRRSGGWLRYGGFACLLGGMFTALCISVFDKNGFLWALAAIPSSVAFAYALIRTA